jgi:histone H1/5
MPTTDDDSVANATAAVESPPNVAAAVSNGSGISNNNKKKVKTPATTTASASAEKENGSSRRRSSGGGGNKLTYQQYIHQAIVALADRTGSSQPAIGKWILQNHDSLGGNAQFKNHLNAALKQGVKANHFVKIKASYKIAAAWKEKERAKKRKVVAAKKQALVKKKTVTKAVTLKEAKEQNRKKLQEVSESLTGEELTKLKAKMARQEESARQRQDAERKVKERAERLRRRRFPMEDTKLHAEDRELAVKPPVDVIGRPYLPYFWHCTLPFDHELRAGKTSSQVLNASKVDGRDHGSFGLVPDVLQVYHFFRGDVHWSGDDVDNAIVPDFSLQHLMNAVEQVSTGNSRKGRMVPPLIAHLFVTCLQMLCQEPVNNDDGSVSPAELKLRRDLYEHLKPALSPASWGDVCFLYMDAMNRYYTTDATQDVNIVQALNTDTAFLLGVQDHAVVPMTPAVTAASVLQKEEDTLVLLPAGYQGYLGDERGVLMRAHAKLARQDPWQLTAEELMALLRALTDDVLAMHSAISEDIAARDEEMHELLRNKRSADAKFRKVRLAFEGPKKPAQKKASNGEAESIKVDTAKDDGNGKRSADAENEDTNEKDKAEEHFKPTATKKQFEAANKAQQKASDGYEKGIRKLVSRTEPIGYDRDFNAVYCFRHDPEILYVENLRPPSNVASHLPEEMQIGRRSWHVIETTSLFDEYVTSLDIRGRREHDLHEELLGPQGAQQSLRRYLHDDVKEQNAANAQLKDKEALKERLENARKKCDEESRRSGRLAGKAEEELWDIEKEINDLEKKISGESVLPETRDYDELTGLNLLRKFDSSGRMETRRTREKKKAKDTRRFDLMPCSKLWSTGSVDGTGLPGMLVASMLGLEENCNLLTPWERKDLTRSAWISRLEGAIYAWNDISPMIFGSPDMVRNGKINSIMANGAETPSQVRRDSMNTTESDRKRRKIESPGASTPSAISHSVSQIITILKQPLLDLEARVAEITNLAVATRDAELADENMSTDGSEDDKANQERLERAWKRIVNRIRNTPTKRHVQIREMVVDAIAAARKAHLSNVVSELRAALLQYHPSAAGRCKASAIEALEAHGDYIEDEDDDTDDDEDEANDDGGGVVQDEIPSVISAEAAILVSCLEGSDDATRIDWINAVKDCKTISRLAALNAAFVDNAKKRLEKLEVERDELSNALTNWEKEEERRNKNRAGKKTTGKPQKETQGPSEVWANVRITDEICMAKAEDYPWWPAKKCEPKNPELAKSLKSLDRTLVSLIGEMGGLRVVKNEKMVPFTGKKIADEGQGDIRKEVRSQLDDCMTMARRILRGRSS